MSEKALYKNLMDLGGGISACLDKGLVGPASILLYSAIDTTGWLDSAEPFATRASFTAWVDRYLLKAKPFACTALDLYAARCGMLHTFSPDSMLSTDGKARRACYGWGKARIDDLQRLIDSEGLGSKYFALHIDDLYEAWRAGLLEFTQELENDDARRTRVHEKATRFFADLGIQDVNELLVRVNED